MTLKELRQILNDIPEDYDNYDVKYGMLETLIDSVSVEFSFVRGNRIVLNKEDE